MKLQIQYPKPKSREVIHTYDFPAFFVHIMTDFKKKEYNPNADTTVFSAHHSDIEKTGQRQCAEHRWRKLNDTEIACTLCPTVHIVNNVDDFIK